MLFSVLGLRGSCGSRVSGSCVRSGFQAVRGAGQLSELNKTKKGSKRNNIFKGNSSQSPTFKTCDLHFEEPEALVYRILVIP